MSLLSEMQRVNTERQLMYAKVQRAIKEVRKILDATRQPQHVADAEHTYDDKYAVVENVTQAALAAQLSVLCDGFGLTTEKLRQLISIAMPSSETEKPKTVTLRFDLRHSCTYKTTVDRDIQSPTHTVRKNLFGVVSTSRTITRVIEHIWNYHVHWQISAYVGAYSTDATKSVDSNSKDDSNSSSDSEEEDEATVKAQKQRAMTQLRMARSPLVVRLLQRVGREEFATRSSSFPLKGKGNGSAGKKARKVKQNCVCPPLKINVGFVQNRMLMCELRLLNWIFGRL